MDKELLSLELSLFGDWLCDKKDNPLGQTAIDDKLISEYISGGMGMFAQRTAPDLQNLIITK